MTPSTTPHFFDSFWKASFYQEGKATSFWKAFWKVVLTVFLLSIATSIFFYVTSGKKLPAYIHTYADQALNGYPSDLVITIKDGVLSKNIPGELQLYPLPKDNVNDKQKEPSFNYMVTINDTEAVSLGLYQKAKSVIVLAKDGAISQDNKGIKIMSYKDIAQQGKDFSFTKSMIVPVVDKMHKYAGATPFVIMAGIVILVTIFAPFVHLMATLFYGLLVMWLSIWLVGKKLSFSESYVLALYALPSILIVTAILQSLPYVKNVVAVIPFFTTILVLTFLKYMFTGLKNDTVDNVA